MTRTDSQRNVRDVCTKGTVPWPRDLGCAQVEVAGQEDREHMSLSNYHHRKITG